MAGQAVVLLGRTSERDDAALGAELSALADRCELVGIEVTGCAPGHAQRVADTLASL